MDQKYLVIKVYLWLGNDIFQSIKLEFISLCGIDLETNLRLYQKINLKYKSSLKYEKKFSLILVSQETEIDSRKNIYV